jgi:hypothetical protein
MKPKNSKNKRDNGQPREAKIDEAIRETFPASDPIAAGDATGTEPPKRSADHKAPIISDDDIEQARQGKGHSQNDSIKRR